MGTCIHRRAAFLIAAISFAANAASEGTYLFSLADTTGTRPFKWAGLSWDENNAELYVIDSTQGSINVFDENGMEVFAFGQDLNVGAPLSVAPTGSGDMFLLSLRNDSWNVFRCNYRGEPRERLTPRSVPPMVMADFRPDTIRFAVGNIYLADKSAMRVVVLDPAGTYVGSYELGDLIDLPVAQRVGIRAFSVDVHGNLLFTIPTLFQAYVMAPDGSFRAFGSRGSSRGKFNVVSGIAADADGNVYVTDMLRAVVIVFDADLNFVTEFGGRGRNSWNLIAPLDVVVGNNKVFVSQSLGGVKTFGVRLN